MTDNLKEKIIEKLREVYDPEIPVNVYDLGLIYDIKIIGNSDVKIIMTLTSPACPTADFMVDMIHDGVDELVEVNSVEVELTFEPLWSPERVSVEIREELGLGSNDDLDSMKVTTKPELKYDEKICFNCGIAESKMPILDTYYKGQKTTICSKCLIKF